MTDRGTTLDELKAKRNVFGLYGGQIGPVMFSTNRIILAATVKVLVAVGLFGFASWQVLSLSILDTATQWFIAGLVALVGLWTIHVILIEVYTGSARRTLEPLLSAEANETGERK